MSSTKMSETKICRTSNAPLIRSIDASNMAYRWSQRVGLYHRLMWTRVYKACGRNGVKNGQYFIHSSLLISFLKILILFDKHVRLINKRCQHITLLWEFILVIGSLVWKLELIWQLTAAWPLLRQLWFGEDLLDFLI